MYEAQIAPAPKRDNIGFQLKYRYRREYIYSPFLHAALLEILDRAYTRLGEHYIYFLRSTLTEYLFASAPSILYNCSFARRKWKLVV